MKLSLTALSNNTPAGSCSAGSLSQLSASLLEPDAPQQILKAWVVTQRIEKRLDFQPEQRS